MKRDSEDKMPDAQTLRRFREAAAERLPDGERQALWMRILKSIEQGRHQRRVAMWRWMAAAAVVLLAGGIVIWLNLSKTEGLFDGQVITHVCRPQERTLIVLPDSSKIWLNAGSRIDYPESFANNRAVRLCGEAWFDVRHNGQPFTVVTAEAEIAVRGTRFTVNDYRDGATADIVLLRGSVEVKQLAGKGKAVALRPNQQWTLDKARQKVTVADVDSTIAASWVTGRMVFKNTPLDDILTRLGHWYNVRFVIPKSEMSGCRLSFTVKSESLTQTLQTIEAIAPEVGFESSDSVIVVRKRF